MSNYNIETKCVQGGYTPGNGEPRQIPIVQSIRECGDAGEPAALSSRPDGLAFLALAEKVAENMK